ncbi:hypothetical protein L218DRAFT_638906 [Marasmius fiardii PR-910]|nr:hypothetical protein L218DRAFT_638906 [Marasmius fiardii PR-910]
MYSDFHIVSPRRSKGLRNRSFATTNTRPMSRARREERELSQGSFAEHESPCSESPLPDSPQSDGSSTSSAPPSPSTASRPTRVRINAVQYRELENIFVWNSKSTRSERCEISHWLGTTLNRTTVWFQNRRMKAKKLRRWKILCSMHQLTSTIQMLGERLPTLAP